MKGNNKLRAWGGRNYQGYRAVVTFPTRRKKFSYYVTGLFDARFVSREISDDGSTELTESAQIYNFSICRLPYNYFCALRIY